MNERLPSFPARIAIAFAAFFRALGDARFASLVGDVLKGGAVIALPPGIAAAQAPTAQTTHAALAPPKPPSIPTKPTAVAPVSVTTLAPLAGAAFAPAAAQAPAGPTSQEGALHLLALLQREGRLLDFCEEELASFSDAAVGAAARLVHSGCRRAMRENLELLPIRTEAEGASVTVPSGFDARAIRLTGNIVGNPPFTGALKHHGWKVTQIKLPDPPRGEASRLLAPAEVELS